MTAEEAKAKWCPYARTHDDTLSGVNRQYDGRPDMGARCIASECMAWRWKQVKNEEFTPRTHMMAIAPAHPADLPSPWKDSDTDGYCGLAGKP